MSWPSRSVKGFRQRPPVVAVHLGTAEISMLALRDRPLRITASGTVQLPIGVVRNRQVRLIGQAASAMDALARALAVPSASTLIMAIEPDSVGYDAGAGQVEAAVAAEKVMAAKRCALEAGFGMVTIDPVPAALARVGNLWSRRPVFASGGGWLTMTDHGHFEASRIRRETLRITVGDSPSTLRRPESPDPVRVAPGIELRGPWPLLLGCALRGYDHGPSVSVTETIDLTRPVAQGVAV